ncbi:hypothetical protein AB0F15_34190 [Amycolatopsis sp. NPDC026612]|uniref:hypothetical protein n=1 Tax=Amycolatopsis sp. NPDC026612 TaxID=3155466 RepID=UPI0033F2A5D1
MSLSDVAGGRYLRRPFQTVLDLDFRISGDTTKVARQTGCAQYFSAPHSGDTFRANERIADGLTEAFTQVSEEQNVDGSSNTRKRTRISFAIKREGMVVTDTR